jgi:uncharacterized protein (TIGR03083 family)
MKVPIATVHLFPILDGKLISLLRSLTSEEWNKPTRAKLWTVKDVASHLLDGNLRTLSMSRDHYFGERPSAIGNYQDLVDWLNQLNKRWVDATRRLSPAVLIELLETTGEQYCKHLNTLNPFEKAIFPVDWAGEKTSLNWFHVAREYTEKWHHQQQIREAVNQPGIITDELYHPVLSTFLLAMPHAYRNLQLPATVTISISGPGGGDWCVANSMGSWALTKPATDADAHISISSDNAWKLFTKGLSSEAAKQAVQVYGKVELAAPFMSLIAVMA